MINLLSYIVPIPHWKWFSLTKDHGNFTEYTNMKATWWLWRGRIYKFKEKIVD